MAPLPAPTASCPTRFPQARPVSIVRTSPTSCCSSLPTRASIVRAPTSAQAATSLLVRQGLLGLFLALGWAAHDEWPGNQHRRDDAENPKGILITQHGRLPQQLLVGVSGGSRSGLGGALPCRDQCVSGLCEIVLVSKTAGDEICCQ